MTILDEIIEHKRGEVAQAKATIAPETMATQARAVQTAPRGFRAALKDSTQIAVIAEVKRRSPSKGLIRADFDPVEIARAYDGAGAACLSVLTDEHFFGGHLDFLRQIRKAVNRPLLRKDFTIDAYQIDEARVAGADAILLIVSALPQALLIDLHEYALSLGLDVLVEVHDAEELDRALSLGAHLIGVNNRNLKTFDVDLSTTENLAKRLPENRDILLVAESGISSFEDVQRLHRAGAAGFLVGESLMRQPDPGKALRDLIEMPEEGVVHDIPTPSKESPS